MLKRTNGMSGFTLAEVLITLGIIGVVAAMTMPTLINSTNGAQYKTAYKKALSVMSQAVAMNIALNDYDLSDTLTGTNPAAGANGTVLDGESNTIYSIFRNRLNVTKVATGADFTLETGAANFYPVITDRDANDYTTFATNHTTTGGGANAGAGNWDYANVFVTITPGNATTSGGTGTAWSANSTFLFMNDGITLIFDNKQNNCRQGNANLIDHYCFGFIDVNGQKGPNRVVECDLNSGDGTVGADDYACTVTNPTDIYPIAMYNQTIIPASAAARAVLFAK